MKPARTAKLPSIPSHTKPTEWTQASKVLADGQWYWLSTVGPDGDAHTVPILCVMADDALWFVAGPKSRKARNLAANASCAIGHLAESMHLTAEGTAQVVRDDGKLERIRDAYADKYQWTVTVRDGRFDAEYGAPTAGPPPFDVYEMTPRVVFGFGVDPSFSPTRWTFRS